VQPVDQNFPGISFTGFRPPDTDGDVGPNHYVQVVNVQFQVFDKSGTSLAGPSNINTLFSTLPSTSLCNSTNRGDPVVLYDNLADRWLISQFAFNTDANNNPIAPFEECIAISQTADPRPSQGYNVYDFNVHNTKFPDYPKLGVWPVAMPGSPNGAYFMTTNQFGGTVPPDAFTGGGGAYAFDRTNMLAGNPAPTSVYFDTTERQMLPSDLDGATAPPANTPNLFVKFRDPGSLEIRSFNVNFSNTTLSTFALTDTVPVAVFDSDMCGGNSEQCIPQPPPSSCTDRNGNDMSGVNPGCRLAAISDRLMFKAAYRNFGSFQSIVVNHTVDIDATDHAGIDWHELRNTGAGWFLQQEGVQGTAADPTHRWMGSVAMDGKQDIALGYSVSSASVSPGVRVAARQPGDAAGTLQSEVTLVNGTGSQTRCQRVNDNMGNAIACRGRWGDYSAMNVDPVDDCTFWYTQEWMPANGQWNTQISAFRFDNCKHKTKTTYTGDTRGEYHDPTTMGGHLEDTTAPGNPGIPGKILTMGFGSESCQGLTDQNGDAACQFTPNQMPGSYQATASFAGDSEFEASTSDPVPYTLNKEETTLSYNGDTNIVNGGTAHMSARLVEEDGTDAPVSNVGVASRPVTFTLSSPGAIPQSCSGTTDSNGTAQCDITSVNQTLGPGTVDADFAGDDFYLPSHDQKATLVFEFAQGGAFVIGDQNAVIGNLVTFWGAHWSSANSLSSGAAPASFKGFEDSSIRPTCGTYWTTTPADSAHPPATVPAFMGVIVSSGITKPRSRISGNSPSIVVVETDPGYAGKPGHTGTGKVVAVVCP
jgi:hypothetical protein